MQKGQEVVVVMAYHSKILILLMIVLSIEMVSATYTCYNDGSASRSFTNPIYVPIGYESVNQDGLNCSGMFDYFGDPDNTFYNTDWYLFYYYYTSTTPDNYRFGYQNPYASVSTYKMLANFTKIKLYYLIYSSIFDINTTSTSNIPIYSKIYDYESTNRGATSIQFNAEVERILVNSSICSEGKCNYYYIEGVSPLINNYTVTNSVSGVSNNMWTNMKLNTSDFVIFDSSSSPKYTNPFITNLTAISPTLLDTLIYVINAPSVKQYGIFVEYDGNKYIITSGLSSQQSFYSDASLRHYIDCNITDSNDSMQSIFIHASGVNYYFDVGAFCDSSTSISVNNSTDLFNCGSNNINKTDTFNYTVYGNTNKSIEIYYMTTNGTWNSIATTGNYEYNLTQTTEVHIYCEGLEVVSSFTNNKGTINSGRAILILVAFMIILGIFFLSKNFAYSVILVYLSMFSLASIGILTVDYGYIVGVLIIGAVLYYIMNFKIRKGGNR